MGPGRTVAGSFGTPTEVLIELQDILWTLPSRFINVALAAEAVRRATPEPPTSEQAGEFTDRLLEADQSRLRARAIAWRIGDDRLREVLITAIEIAAAPGILDTECSPVRTR
jgi:hypothetical protein